MALHEIGFVRTKTFLNPNPPPTASPLAPRCYTEVGLQEYIRIRGARVHNLKDISLSLPHNQLTVITGVSGSGKSSLAFDTIYAEGQRRYVESLSAYARQFLERMEKPAVEDIDGIAPAIAIRQKNTSRNPRSTWPPPPNATTFCGSCSPAWGAPLVPTAARAWSAAPWIRWRSACSPCPPVRAGTRYFPSARRGRSSRPTRKGSLVVVNAVAELH